IVNDYIDIALEIVAEGVHLVQSDMSIAEERKICGDKLIIGLSTHSVEQAVNADQEDVDYITIGPIYKTRVKDFIVGVEIIKPVMDHVDKPVIAIGGINKENIDEVLEQQVKSVAVISAVISADDVKKAASELVEKIKKA
ncbi:MAG: thiamine phosphate synthase, partial [Nanoarchaeota archaeon]|nr:thiamine phosphate synthase [Nanoarchaeota archaeon]